MLFLGLVLGAIPVLHSLLKRIPSYRNYDRIIRERQIDPTALFYSGEGHGNGCQGD